MAHVAVSNGRIAAVQSNIVAASAADVLDARGKLVTPGFVDLHGHIAEPELRPAMLFRDGVTSMVVADPLARTISTLGWKLRKPLRTASVFS